SVLEMSPFSSANATSARAVASRAASSFERETPSRRAASSRNRPRHPAASLADADVPAEETPAVDWVPARAAPAPTPVSRSASMPNPITRRERMVLIPPSLAVRCMHAHGHWRPLGVAPELVQSLASHEDLSVLQGY